MAQLTAEVTRHMTSLKFKHLDEAVAAVAQVMELFRDLRPCLGQFIQQDRTASVMFSLEGTIPVVYKGKVFNIPILIGLLDSQPFTAPLVSLAPTATMELKPGPNVEADGKVHIPYLRDWKYPTSDLLTLVQMLIMTFGYNCPLFTKDSSKQSISIPTFTSSQPADVGLNSASLSARKEHVERQVDDTYRQVQAEVRELARNVESLNKDKKKLQEVVTELGKQKEIISDLKNQLRSISDNNEELRKVKANEAMLRAQVQDLQAKLGEARITY